MRRSKRSRGIDRRAFVKAAVAIGGSAALSACLERPGADDVPQGPADLSTLPTRQHAWNEALSRDDHGNVVNARHHVLLLLDYGRDGPPTAADRETMETALRSLERAYARGNDGLLFTVGYSPAYFDRFDEALPTSVDLPAPSAMAPFEEPTFDTSDAILHLASDHPAVVLEAEEALWGERPEPNGVEMDATLSDLFERPTSYPDRRTGFVGTGLPAEHQDVAGVPDDDPVPEDSPLYMGFKSGFSKNQASEDRVTIRDGPFAGGTTLHVSRIRLRLDDWYVEQDEDARVAEMFCPVHAEEGLVEGAGDNLGSDSGLTDENIENVEDIAREYGRVGHTQKSAGAREDGSPIIIRRDFDSTDNGEAGLHFLAVQRGIEDFRRTREAMNGTDLTSQPAIRQRVNNGILEYTFIKRRGNYLLPPREHRALPAARPD